MGPKTRNSFSSQLLSVHFGRHPTQILHRLTDVATVGAQGSEIALGVPGHGPVKPHTPESISVLQSPTQETQHGTWRTPGPTGATPHQQRASHTRRRSWDTASRAVLHQLGGGGPNAPQRQSSSTNTPGRLKLSGNTSAAGATRCSMATPVNAVRYPWPFMAS